MVCFKAFSHKLELSSNKYTNAVDGCIFCTTTFDDTTANQLNIGYWLANVGCVGTFGSSVGTMPTKSGGRSISPSIGINSKFLPTPVTSEET